MATGIVPVIGRPGIGASVTAQRLNVSRDGGLSFFPGGGTIKGTKARDSGNSASIQSLRPGLLMGKITTGGYYAPSIIGVMTAAAAAAATTVNISAAQATELVRRIGSTGTLRFVGPPSAAGTVATFTKTYSAVNTTTGDVTVSALDAALIAGSFVTDNDGSQTPATFIPDGHNILIPDDSADVNFPRIPVAGIVDVDQLINWPSDTSLKAWVRTNLSTLSGGKFIFSDQF